MSHDPSPEANKQRLVERTIASVEALLQAALNIQSEYAEALARVAPGARDSAGNLLHYLAVRRHDVRDLQRALSRMGLSSLGRMEAHVLVALSTVLDSLYRLAGRGESALLDPPPPVDFDSGVARLAEHAEAILGPPPRDRNTRIMVTLPSEAATDHRLVHELLASGAEILRINGAHDDPHAWGRMVQYLRRAEKDLGRRCRLCFDLGGPKLRTGPVEPGAAVLKWRPMRNVLGRVMAPAQVSLVAHLPDGSVPGLFLPVSSNLLSHARIGDTVELTDARMRTRILTVADTNSGVVHCEGLTTAYVVPGTVLALRRGKRVVAEGLVERLPQRAQAIVLHPGDTLEVFCGEQAGREALLDDEDQIVEPARIGCALPEVFTSVQAGERIFFDDGRIAGVIRQVAPDRMRVEITHAVGGSAKLRGEKGINLPDSELQLPALTPKDVADLEFVARNADMVALSFVQRPSDIETLVGHIGRLGAGHLGIVLKIETQRAFRNLPELLLTAMRHPPVAVMLARGDLGVEVGFERLSEVQEEILWICEAAHIPVIWATQVLESLAKGGMPSRAEVTDAAMGSRAECVMLNKGPYIRETLTFLRDVLTRMQEHHEKKTAMLRRLSISAPQGKPAAAAPRSTAHEQVA